MKQIKTLTVNGISYEIADPDAACIDDAKVGADAWSAKHIIDRLCPAFTETAPAVRCQPVEGYPLQVVSAVNGADTARLWQGGKNILDISTAGVYHNNASSYWMDMYVTETGLRIEPIKDSTSSWSVWGFYLGTAKELAGKTITVSGKVATTITTAPLPWLTIQAVNVEPTDVREKPRYGDGGYVGGSGSLKYLSKSDHHDGYATASYTVTGEEVYPYIGVFFQLTYGGACAVGDWTEWRDIQVEIGDAATEYEPYRGKTLEVPLGKTAQGGSYDWATGILTDEAGETTQYTPMEITALPGVNTLMGYEGDVTVAGRSDPVAILENLSATVTAMLEG